jgi:tetratricopeptide (TPR) repeat protein
MFDHLLAGPVSFIVMYGLATVVLSYLVIASTAAAAGVASDLSTSRESILVRTLSGDELLRIGKIHDVQNHFAEALTYYEQALQSYRGHKQRKGEATVLTKIGSIYERQGRRSEAAVRLREALRLFSHVPEASAHADALFMLARVSLWEGSREEAGRLLDRAADRYSRSGNLQALGRAKIQSGLLKVSDESPSEGIRQIEQVLHDAKGRRDDEQELAALIALGDASAIQDRHEAARAYYEQSLALLERRPQASVEAAVRTRVSAMYDMLDRQGQGIEVARRAVTLYQSLRDLSGEGAAWTRLATLHRTLNHYQEADEALQRALSIYRRQELLVHAIPRQESPGAIVQPESR